MAEEFCSRRHSDRHLTLKDWLQLIALVGALVANYVAISTRLTAVETKVQILYDGWRSGGR